MAPPARPFDQLARVTSNASSNGIPGWFKVETRDGLVYEYGNSADSKLLASGTAGAPPQFWAVNKISDRAGNSMSFVYDTNSSLRRFRPSYILYTASSAGAARYRISFVYQSTSQPEPTLDFTPSTAGGAARSDDKLLDRIELLHDSTVYRKVHFTYESGAGTNKRLKTVQECIPGAPDDCLPATTLGWQSATAGHGSAVAGNTVAAGVLALDINGDGIEDLAWASGGTWRYTLGSASGYGSVINTTVAVTNAARAMPLEWNGDGFEDLLIDWSDGKWRVLKGSATGLATSPVQAGSGTGVSSILANTTWTIADANGDGRDDLLSMTVVDPTLTIRLYLHDSVGFGAPTIAYSSNFLGNGGYGAFSGSGAASAVRQPDFNGDGREDLVINACSQFEYDGPYVWCIDNGWYQLNSNGTTYSIIGNLAYSSDSVPNRYGDFNGDGLTDVVYVAYAPGQWYLGYGQGSGAVNIAPGPSFAGHATYQTLVGDYDGDGYDDLYVTTNSPWQWSVFRGSGAGLSTTPIATGISGNGLGWILTDYNGDGLEDMARYDSASFLWSVLPHLGLPGERLTSAVDGLGNAVTFGYLPMTSATVYTKGTGGIHPTPDIQTASPLLHTLQVAPAGGSSFTLTYGYAKARFSYLHRAYLGMESRTTTDERNGVVTTETFRQDFPYIGAPATTTVKQPAALGGHTMQEVTHTYSAHQLDTTPGNGRVLPYRLRTVTRIHEVGGYKNGQPITKITEDHSVNVLGNSTVVWIETEDLDTGSPEFGSVWRTEVNSTFVENQATWCLGAPLTRSEKRILPGGAFQTRAASWTIAATECRVTQEVVEPGAGSTLSLITDVGYDNCGNVSSVSAYPAGTSGQQRTTSLGYGTRCQRPESISNPLSQASTIAYNWPLGLPSARTDPNGIALSLQYDGFGRLTRQVRPDGTAVRFGLTACTAGNSWCGKNSGARLKVTRTERNTVDGILRTDEQFLDGLGRQRWSHSASLESGPAIVETVYDVFGRPSQRTQPYFAGGTVYATSYTRDLAGRVMQVNAPIDEASPSGRITAFAYEGRDFKITDPRNFTTIRRSNAIGQLRAVTDPSPGGITTYAYHPFGELASITDAASNVTGWTYNLRGFVTGSSDPDLGSWSYVANAFGETTSQTDAKSQNVTFTYDKLSRPLTRIEPEGTTYWTWGNSAAAKNIGQLASVSSPGSYSEAYSFDSLGRLSQQSVSADGTTYYVNLTYHAQTGLLDTLQYPVSTSGYRLKLAYDYSNNLLQKVRDFGGSTIFWQATSTDAWGHVQNETFGNGVATYTDFDQASGLMSAREGGLGGGAGLINAQVGWDLNGNLSQRKDLRQSPTVTEDIYYDSLDRFDYSQRTVGTGSAVTNADVTLDAIGNITWKQGVGSYGYHGTKKRAVVSAGSHTFGYDANGNMTSRNGSSIGYTSYNLPSLIHAGTSSSSIAYGAFRNRYKQVAMDGSGTETTIYVAGLLEKVTRPGGVVEYRHLIAGGGGPAANYTRRSNGTASTYYLHADHLGSPELVTDAAGAVVVRLSFGAYGERRDKDWDGPVGAADLSALANVSRHGFTGHEHLDAVGLIHMNGRVYEPTVGRFLGVDPIIALGASQSPNSYAYVWNNPLTLTDPSGFCPSPDGCAQHFEFGGNGWHVLQDWVRDLEFAQGGGSVVIDPGLPRTSGASVGGGSDRVASFAGVTVVFGVHANSAVGGTQGDRFGIDDAATLGVGLTPAGTLADIYTAATGKDIFTGEEISGLWRFAGVIPWVSEVRKAGKAIDAARTVGHHADPKFLGGATNQSLTRLAEATHKNVHRDLNDFLRTRTDQFGNHMRPQRGNSGQEIRQNFSRQERLEALRDFYRGPGAKYTDAARDFFRQHPGL